jgi:hypothetical protein
MLTVYDGEATVLWSGISYEWAGRRGSMGGPGDVSAGFGVGLTARSMGEPARVAFKCGRSVRTGCLPMPVLRQRRRFGGGRLGRHAGACI